MPAITMSNRSLIFIITSQALVLAGMYWHKIGSKSMPSILKINYYININWLKDFLQKTIRKGEVII